MADTRYSWKGDSTRRNDLGQKVFRLHRRAALVFAGDAGPAMEAVKAIRKSLNGCREPEPDRVAGTVSDCCSRAFANLGRRSEGLWVLVGVYERSGAAHLLHMNHHTDFAPLWLSGEPFPIGLPLACEKFKETLPRVVRENKDHGIFSDDADGWYSYIYTALADTVSRIEDPGIGGRVQGGWLLDDGFSDRWMIKLDKVAEPPAKDHWQDLGRRLSELEGFNLSR